MEPRDFKLIELLMVTLVALGFGVWQLVSVNRELRKTRAENDARKSGEEPPA
jgi:hypothetical protein